MFPFRLGSLPPKPVSALLRCLQIRGLKERRSLSTPYLSISALPRKLPLGGPGWDQLRGEPAITRLDWSFAPRPGSRERFARQHPFGPPQGFRLASPCPGLDRLVSGLTAVTPSPLGLRPSSIFPSTPLPPHRVTLGKELELK